MATHMVSGLFLMICEPINFKFRISSGGFDMSKRKYSKKRRETYDRVKQDDLNRINYRTKAYIGLCPVLVLLAIGGLYLLYLKINANTFDFNFCITIIGTIITMLLSVRVIYLLRPSYIRNEKNKVLQYWSEFL